jgi:hypothetical protein
LAKSSRKPETDRVAARLAEKQAGEIPAAPARPGEPGEGRLRLPFPALPEGREPGLSVVAFRLDSARGKKARAILNGLAALKSSGTAVRPLRASAVFELLLDRVDLDGAPDATP